MFSTTTMASSTMIPDTSTKLNRVISFSEFPVNCIRIMVTMKEKGMPMVTRPALRTPITSQMTRLTSTTPSIRLEPRVPMDSLM